MDLYYKAIAWAIIGENKKKKFCVSVWTYTIRL
jgi:hypothetical protein